MRTQPGNARSRTIMVSSPPPSLAVPAPETPTRAGHDDWLDVTWRWRDTEIRRLEALLTEESVGFSGSASSNADQEMVAQLLAQLNETSDGGESARRLFTELIKKDELRNALIDVEGAEEFGAIIELARQRRGVQELRSIVDNTMSSQTELFEAVRREWWIFGGRYIPPIGRERIPVLESVDLPLIRSDGTIHVVALGPVRVHDLVIASDDGYEVGAEVTRVVNRAITQLVAVEQQADALRALRIESTRAHATAVVGYPARAGSPPPDVIRNTLRRYGTHLAGIEILTYQELIEGAEAALAILAPEELDPYSI